MTGGVIALREFDRYEFDESPQTVDGGIVWGLPAQFSDWNSPEHIRALDETVDCSL